MHPKPNRQAVKAFTLIELLVVIGVIAVLGSILLPALAGAKAKGRTTQCVNNLRQLTLGALVYAADAEDALPYNMGEDEIRRAVAQGLFLNWSSSIMSLELDSDNTNTALLTRGGIGPELSGVPHVYRCPNDNVVSDIQSAAGWTHRVRTYSMNAMTGDAGEYTRSGANTNNPSYRQFFKHSQIPDTARIFLFVEEHPDSIRDGYFLNKAGSFEWLDLPGAYHDGRSNFSYADGHIEPYRWRFARTKPPLRAEASGLPIDVPPGERSDFYWLMWVTSITDRY